jgi:hypothetical protein
MSEKYTYYRIIQLGGHSEALFLERHDPHKNTLKAFISMRSMNRGSEITISMPLQLSRWFALHRELLDYLPSRVLVVIPFNINSEWDINVIANILKALYGFVDVRVLYESGVRAGRVKSVTDGLEPHYRLLLGARARTVLGIGDLYNALRMVSKSNKLAIV